MTSLPTDRPLTVADMLRLADVCERDGYVSNLGTNIRRAFTPAPAPDAALPGGCVLWGPDSGGSYEWRSANGKYKWASRFGGEARWEPIDDEACRNFAAGLYNRNYCEANPPSSSPPAPSKPESVDAERPTTETLDWRDEIYQTALRVLQSAPPLPPATPASKPESPAPSPVEGERDIVHVLDEWSRVHGVSIYIRNKPLQEVTGRAVSTIASLRSSLAAARAEVGRARARAQSVAEDIQEATLILNRAVVDAEGLASSPTVEKGAGK